jgi:hypothetical protein
VTNTDAAIKAIQAYIGTILALQWDAVGQVWGIERGCGEREKRREENRNE